MHELLGLKRSNGGASSEKQSYTTTILLEEIASLRKRVKELEDDTSSSGAHSSPSSHSSDAANFDDIVAALKKDLSKSQNEKANMELDFMNQLSRQTRDHNEAIEELNAKIAKSEREVTLLKDTRPKSKDEAAVAMESLKAAHEAELKQIKDDLAAADKELEVHRKDADELHQKMKDLEEQKKNLSEEVKESRLELENGMIAVSFLRNEVDEVEKHYKIQISKLEVQLRDHGVVQARQQDEIATLNSCVVNLENAKSMLLDEITDLRMQLDRGEEAKANLLKQVDDFNKQQTRGGAILASAAVEQRAKAAEIKIVELEKANQKAQTELREMTMSYKMDVARLEETLSSNEAKADQLKLDVQRKENDLIRIKERCNLLENEMNSVKADLAREESVSSQADTELTSLQLQRVVYEQRMSQCLMEHVAEIDEVKLENAALQAKVLKYKKMLDTEKDLLENQKVANNLKTKANIQPWMNPPPMVRTPSNHSISGRCFTPSSIVSPKGSALRVPSPGRSFPPSSHGASPKQAHSVRELAAAFEPSPRTITPRAGFVGFKQLKPRPEPVVTSADEIEALQQKAESAIKQECQAQVDELQKKALEQKVEEIEELQRNLKEEVEKNAAMEEKLKSQSLAIGALRAEVASLSATRMAIQAFSRKEYEEQSTKDCEEILRLRKELDQAREELELEAKEIVNLKTEIRGLTLERMNEEENAMVEYDDKVAETRKNYSIELNQLQMQITKEQIRNNQLESEYRIQVKELEDTIEQLNYECDRELDAKQAELDIMKYKIDENLDSMKQLESEREQLCLSMNTQSNDRKIQFDELQAELLQATAMNAKLARDVEKLKLQIHNDEAVIEELEHLREKVKCLEGKQRPSNSATLKFMENIQLDDLKAENERLRESLRQTSMDRRLLQDKINGMITEKNESRAVQVLRERNEQLKYEVEKLSKKLSKLDRRGSTRLEV